MNGTDHENLLLACGIKSINPKRPVRYAGRHSLVQQVSTTSHVLQTDKLANEISVVTNNVMLTTSKPDKMHFSGEVPIILTPN
jgi:hypothetical protein